MSPESEDRTRVRVAGHGEPKRLPVVPDPTDAEAGRVEYGPKPDRGGDRTTSATGAVPYLSAAEVQYPWGIATPSPDRTEREPLEGGERARLRPRLVEER